MVYNWQQKDWRQFQYEETAFTGMALSFMGLAGQSLGYLTGLSKSEQADHAFGQRSDKNVFN